MESSENYFGWEMGDTELNHMETLNNYAQNSPPLDGLPINALDSSVIPTHASTYQADPAPPTPSLSSRIIRDAQPADSPWVSKISGDTMQTDPLPAPCLQTQ
jgi:hypothetical protein